MQDNFFSGLHNQKNDQVINTISEYIDIKTNMGDQHFEEKESDKNSEEEYKIEGNMDDLIEVKNDQKNQMKQNNPIEQEEEYDLGDHANNPFEYQPQVPEVKKKAKFVKTESDFSDLFNLNENNNNEPIEFPDSKQKFNNPSNKLQNHGSQNAAPIYKPPINPPPIVPNPQKNNAYSMFATYYATAVQNNQEDTSAGFNASNQKPGSNNQNPFDQFQNNYSN